MQKQMRLDKFLADMGVGTRSEVKNYIRKGMILVNEISVKKPETKVTSDDVVMYQNRRIGYEEYVYYMLNKPAGVVSACEDRKDKTVVDLIEDKARKDIFPVGRLDKDTEGLLLLTNDGGLAHNLLAPGKHVDKCYYAKIDGNVTEEDVVLFGKGMEVDRDFTALPARLRIISSGEVSEIEITICEGKYHQIKRMFHRIGKEVIYLKRLSMGTLVLDNSLASGEYRRLTEKELEYLRGNQ